jgi:hypothetical protein
MISFFFRKIYEEALHGFLYHAVANFYAFSYIYGEMACMLARIC